eukprot:CCRYP_009506-RA/>CCRYP_009506-RA protein AED:0.47 eAED:0.47 QI:0/0/0.5/0.5/0/0/2/820/65
MVRGAPISSGHGTQGDEERRRRRSLDHGLAATCLLTCVVRKDACLIVFGTMLKLKCNGATVWWRN